VYVVDQSNNRIQKFDSNGTFLLKWGSSGSGDGQFNAPSGIGVDVDGNVYVADLGNQRIQKFNSSGAFLIEWGSSGSGDGQFFNPFDATVDPAGNVYVADASNHRIQKFDSNGTFLLKWGSNGAADGQFTNPRGVTVDLAGNVYVADTDNHRIQKFDSSGAFLTKFGSFGSADGQFSNPQGVVVDSAGNVYVADTANHRIQVFEQIASSFTLNTPVDNTAPVANDDSFTTPFETTLTNLNVLLNDTDADFDPLNITSVTTPSNGTAVINATDNGITYTPDNGFDGIDSFNYTASDGIDNDTATVTITVELAEADLAITKTVDQSLVNYNDTVTFTVIINNTGPDNATNIVVTDFDQLADSTNTTTLGSYDGDLDYTSTRCR